MYFTGGLFFSVKMCIRDRYMSETVYCYRVVSFLSSLENFAILLSGGNSFAGSVELSDHERLAHFYSC